MQVVTALEKQTYHSWYHTTKNANFFSCFWMIILPAAEGFVVWKKERQTNPFCTKMLKTRYINKSNFLPFLFDCLNYCKFWFCPLLVALRQKPGYWLKYHLLLLSKQYCTHFWSRILIFIFHFLRWSDSISAKQKTDQCKFLENCPPTPFLTR